MESVVYGSGVKNNFNPGNGFLPVIVDEHVDFDIKAGGTKVWEIDLSMR